MKILFPLSLLVLILLSGCQGRNTALVPKKPSADSAKVASDFLFTEKNIYTTFSSAKKEEAISSKLYSVVSSAKHIPILKDIGKLKNISLKNIPIVRHISLLKNYLPKSSKNTIRRIYQTRKTRKKTSPNTLHQFSGGIPSSDLDINKIEIDRNAQYTRLILKSYDYKSKKTASHSGKYTAFYKAKNHSIHLEVRGYKSLSALKGTLHKIYKNSAIIQNIDIFKESEHDTFSIIITLKQEAKINLFELHNPAQIIIDITPMYRLFGEAS